MAVVTAQPSMAASAGPLYGEATGEPSRSARRRAAVEQWYPWFFGFVAALAIFLADPSDSDVYAALKGCLGSAVDAAAILAGFQGTALGLLLALLNTAPVKALRRMGLFGRLVQYHSHAILAMLAAAALSMVLLAAQGVVSDFGSWSRWIATLAAFVAVSASLAALRVTLLMVEILVHPKLDSPDATEAKPRS